MSFPAGAQSGAGSRCVAINQSQGLPLHQGWGWSEASLLTLPGYFPSRLLIFSVCAVEMTECAEQVTIRLLGSSPPVRTTWSGTGPARAGLGCPSSTAGLWLRRHGRGPAEARPAAPTKPSSRGAPAKGLDLGGERRHGAQLWGEENSSFPWEPEEESFWGCGWDSASQARQRDPESAISPLCSWGKAGPAASPLPVPPEVPPEVRDVPGLLAPPFGAVSDVI